MRRSPSPLLSAVDPRRPTFENSHGSTARRLLAAALFLGACSSRRESSTSPPTTPTHDDIFLSTPDGWSGVSPGVTTYQFGVDHTDPHGGSSSGLIQGSDTVREHNGSLNEGIRADSYRGHRVRWSGWIRTDSVVGYGGGLYLRVDSPGRSLLDNMTGERITGTTGWQSISVVVDVPPSAIGIGFGAILSGKGRMRIDDLTLSIVDTNVPLTNPQLQPFAGPDSLSVLAGYFGSTDAPIDADFEGLAPPPSAAVSWLTSHLSLVNTIDPSAPLTDLGLLPTVVGRAPRWTWRRHARHARVLRHERTTRGIPDL